MMVMIGVGGCGMNILEYMTDSLPENACTIGVNRDADRMRNATKIRHQVLLDELSSVDKWGDFLPTGKAEMQTAMRRHWPELQPMLHDADNVCILAGLGGATGSWASQVIVQRLKNMEKRTTMIAVEPFGFERQRIQIAKQAQNAFTSMDYLLTCSNEQLINWFNPDTPMLEAFATMNEFIVDAWKQIEQGKVASGQYRIVASVGCSAGSGHPLAIPGFELVRIYP